jgi:uncharacterized cupin superfamily protein
MASFSKWNAKQDPRTELHDVLGLTGAEISINNLPAGAGVPFVHSHKKNEEIYQEHNHNIRFIVGNGCIRACVNALTF